MTKKKSRNVQPYTINVAMCDLGGFEKPLSQVLHEFFDEAGAAWISKRILQAITDYNLELQANPQRKNARKQRDDRDELIECMRELSVRLDPTHIPLPLLKAVRSAYTRYERSIHYEINKEAVDEEIHDLLLRLDHLRKVFQATEIPARAGTNPGKRERGRLVKGLKGIFNDARKDGCIYPLAPSEQLSKQFVQGVFAAFHLKPPPPRLF